jgi:glycosyltransferase involved in cell wall biosynthesis
MAAWMATLPRIDQFHPVIVESSAVSNEIANLRSWLRQAGYQSDVFAGSRGRHWLNAESWKNLHPSPTDVLLIHYSHDFSQFLPLFETRCRRILIYHSVTPGDQLSGADPDMIRGSAVARSSLPSLASSVESCVAHSRFSAGELETAGYSRVGVLPYAFDGSRWPAPRQDRRALRGNERLLIAVGRVFPHKGLEHCLLVADYLRRYIDARWRFVAIGPLDGGDAYIDRLGALATTLGMDPAQIFTGCMPFSELKRWYERADAYICMSGHEGFGVTLLEAMAHNIPVFAHAAGAIPEVLGSAGVLFSERDWPLIAESIHATVENPRLLASVLRQQSRRIQDFQLERVRALWLDWFASL